MFDLIARLTIGEWVAVITIAFAAVTYGVREALDLLGKSPRASRLRDENADLLRINRELTDKVERHENEIRRLETKVSELQARDQKAVLEALAQHEVSADRRADATHLLLREIADNLKGGVTTP
jgi:uncharacterized protein YlxW (UPF0749 family)